MDKSGCFKALKKELSPKRFAHCQNVALSAAQLAKQYGADVQKAEIAGLLHDITKEFSNAGQLQIIEEFGIILDNVERYSPSLWHAVTAPAFLSGRLGVQDEEILRAVRYHTTARAGMTTLEKVLYVADYISADRTYPGVEDVRRSAQESLDEAMLQGLSYTICNLGGKGAPLHPDTVAAYNEITCARAKNKTD